MPLADTAQVQLMNSIQIPDESLDDWADQLMLLAEKASTGDLAHLSRGCRQRGSRIRSKF